LQSAICYFNLLYEIGDEGEMDERTEPLRRNPHFLGVPVTADVKSALKSEAKRRSAEVGHFVGAAAVAREAIEVHLVRLAEGMEAAPVTRRNRPY
jgi:hypothetical protein